MNATEIPTTYTANGVEITEGLLVWTNDLERGKVRLGHATNYPGEGVWFYVQPVTVADEDYAESPAGLGRLMNGERVSTRHPFTGETA